MGRTEQNIMQTSKEKRGSGCASVGRAVDSDTRDPQFESSHWQIFYWPFFIVNCIEKAKIKKKRPVMAHFFKKR